MLKQAWQTSLLNLFIWIAGFLVFGPGLLASLVILNGVAVKKTGKRLRR
jgi:ABC-type transport system involved in multi-copper enzyme maturation permease subunit